MQASFSPQEQELIQKLKEKYEGARCGDVSQVDTSCVTCETAEEPPPRASARPATNVEASVCPHCHGTGTLVEIYNHRRLENYCKDCEGRGVRVYKNGVEVRAGESATDPKTSSSACGAPGVIALHASKAADDGSAGAVHGRSGSGSELSAPERAAAMQKDLQRLAMKTAEYTKERLDTLALLQRPATEPESQGREAAARELVAQLDIQLERLELTRRKKQAALERLRAAAGSTLDPIITNGGH